MVHWGYYSGGGPGSCALRIRGWVGWFAYCDVGLGFGVLERRVLVWY